MVRLGLVDDNAIERLTLSLNVANKSTSVPRRSLRIKRSIHDYNDVDCKSETNSFSEFVFKTQKSQKRKREDGSHLTFEFLCNDVIDVIYSMIDSPRDLYNLAFCNKRLLSIVSYKHIVRAAVFQQKNAQKTVASIIEAIRRRTIYLPSITRLLRLVNGRRCERGKACWGFDMINKKSSPVNFARQGIGLFLCRKCISGMTTPFQRDISWALQEEDKIAVTIVDYSIRGSNQLCTNTITGQPIGPIVTMMDLKQITHTYQTISGRDNDNPIFRKAGALNDIIQEREKSDKNSFKRVELLNIYDDARSDLAVHNKRLSEELDAKIKTQNRKRLYKLRGMHRILCELLEDHLWKDFALECTFNEGGICFNDAYMSYKCGIVHDVMRKMIDAPSTVSRKKIKIAAEKIRNNFDLILGTGFLSYDFLEGDELERSLQAYCADLLNPERIFSKIPNISCDFMAFIRQGKLTEAFFLVIPEHDDILQKAFARSVEISDTPYEEDDFISLASSVWTIQTETTRNPWSGRSKQALNHQRELCKEKYIDLKDAILSYMECTDTQTFLSGPNEMINGITRLDAVKTMYKEKHCYQYLQMRDFQALYAYHRRFYMSGGEIYS